MVIVNADNNYFIQSLCSSTFINEIHFAICVFTKCHIRREQYVAHHNAEANFRAMIARPRVSQYHVYGECDACKLLNVIYVKLQHVKSALNLCSSLQMHRHTPKYTTHYTRMRCANHESDLSFFAVISFTYAEVKWVDCTQRSTLLSSCYFILLHMQRHTNPYIYIYEHIPIYAHKLQKEHI